MRLRSLLGLASVMAACVGGGEIPADGGSTSSSGASSSDGGSTSNRGGGGAAETDGGSAQDGGSGPQGGASDGGASEGGAGGGGDAWPVCDNGPPAGATVATLEQIWDADPDDPTAYWVEGVYVSAVSGNGCNAGGSCQLFVQSEESYASLAAASHQSIRLAALPAVSEHFVGLAVGDRIDLFARALRDTANGKNELIFLVSPNLPGCAEVVGSGTLSPTPAVLADLTVEAYETEIGPVLIQVDTVSGRPNAPTATFGLWETGQVGGGDLTTVTSLSPTFLEDQTFTGLTQDLITDFTHVIGVYGQFAPQGSPGVKYEEIYVRSVSDYPIVP